MAAVAAERLGARVPGRKRVLWSAVGGGGVGGVGVGGGGAAAAFVDDGGDEEAAFEGMAANQKQKLG